MCTHICMLTLDEDMIQNSLSWWTPWLPQEQNMFKQKIRNYLICINLQSYHPHHNQVENGTWYVSSCNEIKRQLFPVSQKLAVKTQGFQTTNMPYHIAQIRNNKGDEQHSWVMTSPVCRSLNDLLQKWGKSGGCTGRKVVVWYVKHLTLNKLSWEVSGVFLHTHIHTHKII